MCLIHKDRLAQLLQLCRHHLNDLNAHLNDLERLESCYQMLSEDLKRFEDLTKPNTSLESLDTVRMFKLGWLQSGLWWPFGTPAQKQSGTAEQSVCMLCPESFLCRKSNLLCPSVSFPWWSRACYNLGASAVSVAFWLTHHHDQKRRHVVSS